MKTFIAVPVAALAIATLAACSAPTPPSNATSPVASPTPFTATNGEEWTVAIVSDDMETLTALVDEYGALAIIDERTALHIAADAANVEAVALLVEAGADLEARDARERTNWSAIHFAANSDCGPCIDVLMEAGADPNAKDRFQPGRAAIHVAASVNATEALAALLNGGVEVDALDNGSGHALMWAAYYGQTEAAQFLLANGSEPTLTDGSGHNPSTRAAGQGHDALAEILADAIEQWSPAG